LVLGSGISKPYGLPDWENLSKILLSKHLAKSEKSDYIDDIAEFLVSYNSNFTVLVRNIYQNFKKNSEDQTFEEFVREVIYEKFDDTRGYDSYEQIKDMMNNLDSIITYNFDDILDKYLEKNGSREIKTIYDTGMQPETGQLPIYHVHGLLPKEGDLYPNNKITLSEDLYHQLYTDIYCWNNIIQINKFTNNTCLFIGTSLTDPNLRRLLDVAKGLREEKSIPHFMLIKHKDEQRLADKTMFIDKIYEKCEKNGVSEKEEQDTMIENYRQLFINRAEILEEDDAHSFGIGTIWINDHDEIPTVLKEIRNS
jgi:serine/threonine protein kinase